MRGREVRKVEKKKAGAGEIESGEFAEQILKELIDEGYSGYELLDEFSVRQSKVRPAVEAILEEAKNGSITNFVGFRVPEIFPSCFHHLSSGRSSLCPCTHFLCIGHYRSLYLFL